MNGHMIDKDEFVNNGYVTPIGEDTDFDPVKCIIDDIWEDSTGNYWRGDYFE